jgi:hypothetical protein
MDGIEDLYLNGTQPSMGQGGHGDKYREHIRSEARKVVRRLAGRQDQSVIRSREVSVWTRGRTQIIRNCDTEKNGL